jgi:transposase-like protein
MLLESGIIVSYETIRRWGGNSALPSQVNAPKEAVAP